MRAARDGQPWRALAKKRPGPRSNLLGTNYYFVLNESRFLQLLTPMRRGDDKKRQTRRPLVYFVFAIHRKSVDLKSESQNVNRDALLCCRISVTTSLLTVL